MKTAIAIMKSGRSFAEASEITCIPVDEIMKEWGRLNYDNSAHG